MYVLLWRYWRLRLYTPFKDKYFLVSLSMYAPVMRITGIIVYPFGLSHCWYLFQSSRFDYIQIFLVSIQRDSISRRTTFLNLRPYWIYRSQYRLFGSFSWFRTHTLLERVGVLHLSLHFLYFVTSVWHYSFWVSMLFVATMWNINSHVFFEILVFPNHIVRFYGTLNSVPQSLIFSVYSLYVFLQSHSDYNYFAFYYHEVYVDALYFFIFILSYVNFLCINCLDCRDMNLFWALPQNRDYSTSRGNNGIGNWGFG